MASIDWLFTIIDYSSLLKIQEQPQEVALTELEEEQASWAYDGIKPISLLGWLRLSIRLS